LTVLQVIEHYFDFLQFYVVPTMDFIEQPPSVSLRRRIFPLLVGVDDLLLNGSPMAAVDKVFEVSSHSVIIPEVAQKEDDCDPDTEWIRLETTPGRD